MRLDLYYVLQHKGLGVDFPGNTDASEENLECGIRLIYQPGILVIEVILVLHQITGLSMLLGTRSQIVSTFLRRLDIFGQKCLWFAVEFQQNYLLESKEF